MGIVGEAYAVAAAAVGTNLASGKWWENANVGRRITEVGLTGGNAIAECCLEIYYGSEKVGEIYATTSGDTAPQNNRDIKPLNTKKYCKKGEQIRVVVKSAPTVSGIDLHLNIMEFSPFKSGSWGNRSGYGGYRPAYGQSTYRRSY